jgi:hypothetical protein
MLKTYREQYPNICLLGIFANLIPISTASCERGFSALNQINTKQRNRFGKLFLFYINPKCTIEERNLEICLRVYLESPAIQKFDYQSAIAHWKDRKERRFANA